MGEHSVEWKVPVIIHITEWDWFSSDKSKGNRLFTMDINLKQCQIQTKQFDVWVYEGSNRAKFTLELEAIVEGLVSSSGKELHFYPGQKKLVYFIDGCQKATVEAWGGPANTVSESVMNATPTTSGRFVIHNIEPYRTNTWSWSKIKWGDKTARYAG